MNIHQAIHGVGAYGSNVVARLLRGRAELAATQARLGTPEERPDDIERAQALAHEIANMLTVLALTAAPHAQSTRICSPRFPVVAEAVRIS